MFSPGWTKHRWEGSFYAPGRGSGRDPPSHPPESGIPTGGGGSQGTQPHPNPQPPTPDPREGRPTQDVGPPRRGEGGNLTHSGICVPKELNVSIFWGGFSPTFGLNTQRNIFPIPLHKVMSFTNPTTTPPPPAEVMSLGRADLAEGGWLIGIPYNSLFLIGIPPPHTHAGRCLAWRFLDDSILGE